jgi:hypothetical protein
VRFLHGRRASFESYTDVPEETGFSEPEV